MPTLLSDYERLYDTDPKQFAFKSNSKKQQASQQLPDKLANPKKYLTDGAASVFKRKGMSLDVNRMWMLGTFGTDKPTYDFKLFDQGGRHVGWYKLNGTVLEFYGTNGVKEVTVGEAPPDIPYDQIDSYYEGREREVSSGEGSRKITIQITETAWNSIRGHGEDQILGILRSNPVPITTISTLKGQRLIKPEPYGWIFSTSQNTRLVANDPGKNKVITKLPAPGAQLVFDHVHSAGH